MTTISPLNGVLSRMATLSRAMDDVIGQTNESLNGQYWVPSMDAWETEQAFVVQVDLPGLTPEQVDVSFDRNTLTVRGTRSDTIPTDKGEKRVFFVERSPGSFSRTLRFPQYVEASKIDAKFENGVLTVTVPKSEAAKPRKITIT
ncbi:MAG TPA: Hsp20/alpha crystallin family protein [Vicinamibacterales bacterium]|nr:Hsp20/alpha crystallin family protein [Gemmatimonadaceae bacterium]HYJ95328.1 Hsp20/alpha crystallin family protein [Vicinamibacterales bacterium]